MRGRIGVSYALSAALAFAIAAAVAGMVVYMYSLSMGSAAAAALKEGELQVRRSMERLSVVYWIGDRLALKNYGEVPVTIKYVFTDKGFYPQAPLTLSPGEIKVLSNIPSSDKLGVVTENSVMILRQRGAAAGGGSPDEPPSRISITDYGICFAGGNYKVKVSVKNTGSVRVHAVNFIYVGTTGATQVDSRNWVLDPGAEVKNVEILFKKVDWGDGVYIRVVGFSSAGGAQVSDAIWLPFEGVSNC